MNWSEVFELIGKGVTVIASCAGAWWGWVKWKKRDELFPRVYFEVSANFLGVHKGKIVTELIATLENKGIVPLKIHDFSFKLMAIKTSDPIEKGSSEIRGQLLFPHVIESGEFVPKSWDYSFVYPGVKTEYNFVTAIPLDASFVRMQGDFEYYDATYASHHASKTLKVPDFDRGKEPVSGDT